MTEVQKGFFAALAASAIWGAMYVVSRVVLEVIPPLPLVALRMLISALFIFGLYLLLRRELRIPKSVSPASLAATRDFARENLGLADPATDPKDLMLEVRDNLTKRQAKAEECQRQAKNGLPFAQDLETILSTLRAATSSSDTAGFLDQITSQKDTLEANLSSLARIERFYTQQLELFLNAKTQIAQLDQDLLHLPDSPIKKAVNQAKAIISSPDPSKELPRVAGLLEPALQAVELERQRLKEVLVAQIQEQCRELSQAALPTAQLEALQTEVQGLTTLDSLLARANRPEKLAAEVRKAALPEGAVGQKAVGVILKRIRIRSTAELEVYLAEVWQRAYGVLEAGGVVDLE